MRNVEWYRIVASEGRSTDIVSALNQDAVAPEMASSLLAEVSYFNVSGIVEAFLARGASLSAHDVEGKTAVGNSILGCRDGNNTGATFSELLRAGSEANQFAAFGLTPLQLAIECDIAEYAVVLLSRGADPSIKSLECPQLDADELARKLKRQWAIDVLRRWHRGNVVSGI
jgi:ankyrin repeat protein